MGIRLIVAGSREYPAIRATTIHAVLSPYLKDVNKNNSDQYILVHGACPPRRNRDGGIIAGFDYFAAKFWVEQGGTCEPYPADWARECDKNCTHKQVNNGFCPAAGPRRNQLMADLGGNECLGFPWFDNGVRSSGTLDMMGRANAARILTHRIKSNGYKERYTGAAPQIVPTMWPIKPPDDRPSHLRPFLPPEIEAP